MPPSLCAITGTLQGGLHLLIFEEGAPSTPSAPYDNVSGRRMRACAGSSSSSSSSSYTCSVQPLVSSSSNMFVPGAQHACARCFK